MCGWSSASARGRETRASPDAQRGEGARGQISGGERVAGVGRVGWTRGRSGSDGGEEAASRAIAEAAAQSRRRSRNRGGGAPWGWGAFSAKFGAFSSSRARCALFVHPIHVCMNMRRNGTGCALSFYKDASYISFTDVPGCARDEGFREGSPVPTPAGSHIDMASSLELSHPVHCSSAVCR